MNQCVRLCFGVGVALSVYGEIMSCCIHVVLPGLLLVNLDCGVRSENPIRIMILDRFGVSGDIPAGNLGDRD